jgi:rRNA-processing protein FCF1
MESIKKNLETQKAILDNEILTYCAAKGIDFSNIIEIEFQKANIYLNKMLLKSERALMNEQANDLPNELRIKMLEDTFFQLKIIQERFIKQNETIKRQELEIRNLHEKFDFFKKDYRK